MTHRIWIAQRPTEGLAVIVSQHGKQLYSTGRARKDWKCEGCGRPITMGDAAYRTVNASTMNRMWRICTACVEAGPPVDRRDTMPQRRPR